MRAYSLAMLISAEASFNLILDEASDDLNILAFWLDGSRGKGFENEYSDYDCTMIVKEDVLNQYKSRYENSAVPEIDLTVTTLPQFREYAAWGSDT